MNRYQDIPVIKSSTGKQIYATSRYPEIPLSENDIYVYTTQGDRYDVLALNYYGDSSLWWIISIGNDLLPKNSIFIQEGTQLRIPVEINSILTSYKQLNS